MPKFRIVVEQGSTELLFKEFEAENMDAAKDMAKEDGDWSDKNGWDHYDANTTAEIREDQCEEIK